jgi:hypothetical protein
MQTTNYGAQVKRKLITGRRDKQKDGPAVLKVRVPEIPSDPEKGAVYEHYHTDNGEFCYQVFSGVTGIVTDIYRANKTIMGNDKAFLFVDLESGGEPITWEVGNLDGRYAMNLMARMLNPYYIPQNPAYFSPYAFKADVKDETGKIIKQNADQIGVSVQQGADKVTSPGRVVMEQMGQPQPITWQGRGGKTEYDFMPVAEWMLQKCREKLFAAPAPISRDNGFEIAPVQTNVKPSPASNTLDSSNIAAMLDAFDKKAAEPDPFAGMKEMVVEDDLPF